MRVIFMGTPEFAVKSLSAIYSSKHEVIAVITQPDKPADRGIISIPPVKKFAINENLPVYQFDKISKEGEAVLKDLNADIFVTAAYGQILSKNILQIPKYGIVNVHASLLPAYRGSSPVQWAIINGEKETGVTIMQTAEGLDTGDILLTKKIGIDEFDTTKTLMDKLAELGAEAIVEYLDLLQSGKEITPIKQDEDKATYYPMLKKNDGKIDWTKSATEIFNLMRGTDPWPGTFAEYNGKKIKLYAAEKISEMSGKAGTVLQADKKGFIVACGEGALSLIELQMEGKKRMKYNDFLNGVRIKVGEELL